MRTLHFISPDDPDMPRICSWGPYPLGTPGRFTDFIQALQEDGHDSIIVMPSIPVLQAALERKEIPFILNNITFINHVFRRGFYKKIIKEHKPDIILTYGDHNPNRGSDHDPEQDEINLLIDIFDGPVRGVMDVYSPVVTPDSSIKKIDREETLTDPLDFVIGCFAPGRQAVDGLNILFQAVTGRDDVSLWFAIAPYLSQHVQAIAKIYGLDHKCRFFDVTVPRGGFYKGVDMVFVPNGQVDSDLSFVESLSLGRPVISCAPQHAHLADPHDLVILPRGKAHELTDQIDIMSRDKALCTRLGEAGRNVYEEHLSALHGIKNIISHL